MWFNVTPALSGTHVVQTGYRRLQRSASNAHDFLTNRWRDQM
jgi:hypothetical protein